MCGGRKGWTPTAPAPRACEVRATARATAIYLSGHRHGRTKPVPRHAKTTPRALAADLRDPPCAATRTLPVTAPPRELSSRPSCLILIAGPAASPATSRQIVSPAGVCRKLLGGRETSCGPVHTSWCVARRLIQRVRRRCTQARVRLYERQA
jgi:hypothetical protein